MAFLLCLAFDYCCLGGDTRQCFNHQGSYKETILTTKANHPDNRGKEIELEV